MANPTLKSLTPDDPMALMPALTPRPLDVGEEGDFAASGPQLPPDSPKPVPMLGSGLKSYAMPSLSPRQQEINTERGQAESALAKLNGPHLGQPGSKLPGIGGKILHGLSIAGNILGNSLFAPEMAMIPGTQLNTLGQKNRLQGELQSLGKEEEGEKNDESKRTLEAEQTEALKHPKKGETVNTGEGVKQFDPQTGKYDIDVGSSPATAKPDKYTFQDTDHGLLRIDSSTGEAMPVMFNGQAVAKNKASQKPDSPEQQFIDSETAKGVPLAQALSRYAAITQKPEHDQRQLAVGPDGTVLELRPGMKVPQGTKSMSGDLAGGKPTADEQRRADLAENLNENLDTLEEIAKRRPELFGPVAGRLTSMKAGFGTSDPDIATLETIKHQIGMAQISAHGMRSAQGIQAAGDSILNSFHNSPQALVSSIHAARNSVKTFAGDVERAKAGGATSQESAPQRPANVPEGYVFKADGPKGKGWYRP